MNRCRLVSAFLGRSIVLGALVGSIALAACSTSAPPPTTASQGTAPAPGAARAADKITIRLDWLATGYHVPFFVALDRGLFEQNGIEATIGEGRGSAATVQAVAAGQETFGMADASVLPRAVQQGAAVKMVAGYQQLNSSGIMFFKDSGIQTPKDLEGKQYGDVPGGAQSLLFPAVLKAAGADISKVTIITTDAANKDRGFLQHQYDATLTQLNDSFIKLKAQGQDLGALAYADYGINVLGHGVITSNKLQQENPDLVRRFVRSWLQAVQAAQEDPAEAARIAKQHNPDAPEASIQADMLRESLKRMATANTQGKPPGWMAEADWQQTIDLLLEYGALDQPIAPGQLYTNDFLPS